MNNSIIGLAGSAHAQTVIDEPEFSRLNRSIAEIADSFGHMRDRLDNACNRLGHTRPGAFAEGVPSAPQPVRTGALGQLEDTLERLNAIGNDMGSAINALDHAV